MLFLGFVLTVGALFLSENEVNATVIVQGSELSDVEYAELLESIPEGHELVPNEEYEMLVNQRAQSGLFHNSHMQSYGWLGATGVDYYMGIPGKSLRMEAFQMNVLNMGTSISYRAHVQSIGWQGWKSNGGIAGTTGRGLRIEAIQINTSGLYGVSYRSHVQSHGWLGWTSSGASSMFGYYSGTTGQGKRMEAVELKLYRQTL